MKNNLKLTVLCFFIGSMMHSRVAVAQSNSIPENVDFRVFPNPNETEKDTYLSLQGFKANDLLIVVYDMLGREIYSKVEMVENSGFLFTLTSEGKKLPAGVYLITASANDNVFNQKLIVK